MNWLFYFGLLMISFFWGTSFAGVKIGLTYVSQVELVLVRLIIAATLFAIILFAVRKKIDVRIKREDYGLLVWLSFIGVASYYPIQTFAVNLTITIHTALIMATSPILTAIMAVFMNKERMGKGAILGIATAFAGVSMIITGGDNSSAAANPNMLWGDLVLMINSLTWAYFTIKGGQLMKKYLPFISMAYIFIIGTLMIIPFAVLYSFYQPIDITKAFSGGYELILIFLYLGGLCSVYSYFFWYKAVREIGPVKTSVFMYLNPLFAMVVGISVLGEQVNIYSALGGVLVLAGVYMVNRSKMT